MGASSVRPFYLLRHLQRHRFSSTSTTTTTTTNETPLQRSIRSAIESRDYLQIPNLLQDLHSNPNPNPNPFSYLSLLPPTLTACIVGNLLHSFLPLRPRSLPLPAYSSLLSLSLTNSGHNFPSSVFLSIALAVLQATLRSGAPPPRETRLSLPLSWLSLRRRRRPVAGILSSLRPLGFRLDLNTLNYLLSSLCAAGEPAEAVAVLHGMPAAGIDPDSESYCTVIEAADDAAVAEALLSEMVAEKRMTPRKGTVARVVTAMRAEGKVRRAAETVKSLEGKGCAVGFEAYEAVAEGCVESGEMVLAARVVAEMARKGFVPYVGVRQRVVEGLAAIGQGELAGAVRQRLAEIGS